MGRTWDAVKNGLAQNKQQRKKPRLNRDEREFQAAAIEILETPASPAARVLATLIMVFASAALVWSWFGRIETHAEVQGKVIPVGRVQVIEPLVTATVKAIHVEGGQAVRRGDLLVELDPTEFTAERQKLSDNLALAKVSAARLRATLLAVAAGTSAEEAAFVRPTDASEDIAAVQLVQMRRSLAAFRAEQASFDADIAAKRGDMERSERTLAERRKLVALNNERLDVYLKLENRGVGVRSNTLDAREGEQNQVVALAAEESRVAGLEAEALVLAAKKRERREAYLDRVATELVEAERAVATLRQDLAKAELMERSSTLKAPVSGRVQQVAVTTLGQVVQTGQELMTVVPDGTALEIEGLLPNREKGFVREGQAVRVKLEAFPFTRYGTLEGRVITVSNDSVPAGNGQGMASGPLMFPVRIALDATTIRADGVDVALTPGMAVTGEVKTGERRVLEFLLDPLIEVSQGAFHER